MASLYDPDDRAQRQRELERRRRYEQRRRAHIRKQRLVFGGGGLLILLILILIIRSCSKEPQEISTVRYTPNMKTMPEIHLGDEDLGQDPDPARQSRSITLAAVGDIMCYDEQLQDALTDGRYDFTAAFSEVAETLSAADVAIGNLETTFADDNPYAGKPNFNSPPELAGALAGAGFDVLSTANTYSIQYGINGLFSTLLHTQQAGITPVGTYFTQEERNLNGSAVIRDVDGVRVAFLAYTKGVNNMYLPDGYEYSVNMLYDDYYFAYTGFRKKEILADISAAKEAGADVIVCMLHWGSEYESAVTAEQENIADTLLSAGVNIIIGSHSHVVSEVEMRDVTLSDGSVRQGLVAWSLGNFYSYMSREGTMESLILQIALQVDEDGVHFTSVDYVPVCTSYDEDMTHFRVTNIPLQIDRYLSVAEGSVDAATYETYQSIVRHIDNRVGTNYMPREETEETSGETPEET